MIGFELFDPSAWTRDGLVVPLPPRSKPGKKKSRLAKTAFQLAISTIVVAGAGISSSTDARTMLSPVLSGQCSQFDIDPHKPSDQYESLDGEPRVPDGYWRMMTAEMRKWEGVAEDSRQAPDPVA